MNFQLRNLTTTYISILESQDASLILYKKGVFSTETGIFSFYSSIKSQWRRYHFGLLPQKEATRNLTDLYFTLLASESLTTLFPPDLEYPYWYYLISLYKTLRDSLEISENDPPKLQESPFTAIPQIPTGFCYNDNSCFYDTLFFMMFVVTDYFDPMLKDTTHGAMIAHRNEIIPTIVFSNPLTTLKSFVNKSECFRLLLKRAIIRIRNGIIQEDELDSETQKCTNEIQKLNSSGTTSGLLRAAMGLLYTLEFAFNNKTGEQGTLGEQNDIVELLHTICMVLNGYNLYTMSKLETKERTLLISPRDLAIKRVNSQIEYKREDFIETTEMETKDVSMINSRELLSLDLTGNEGKDLQYIIKRSTSQQPVNIDILYDPKQSSKFNEILYESNQIILNQQMVNEIIEERIINDIQLGISDSDYVLVRQTKSVTYFVHAPKVMVFNLKRFEQKDQIAVKSTIAIKLWNDKELVITFKIETKRFLDSEIQTHVYQVFAVACISGDETGKSGHYTCYFQRNGQWYFYNDLNNGLVIPLEESELIDMKVKIQTEGYLFFANKI